MRVEKYFAWQHLPKHLQEISKPFAEVSQHISPSAIKSLISNVKKMPSNDEEETAFCLQKLTQAMTKQRDSALRLLLEAKDCAVRAALP